MSMIHPSRVSLAAALGVSGPGLAKWQRLYPDAPKELDEEAWRAYMKANGLGTRSHGHVPTKDRETLTNEKLESEVRLNQIKIAKEERKLIPASEVEAFLLYAATKTKSALFQMVAETAPKCAGLEAGEIRGIMRNAADAICLSMQTTVEDWQREQEEARKAAEQATGATPHE